MNLQRNDLWNENELLCQLKSGNRKAFTRLYEMYSERLYLNLLRLLKSESEAEEILQEIFLKVWEKRETIVIHNSVKAYLFRIAENKVHDFFRKLKRDRKLYCYIREVSSGESQPVEARNLHQEESAFLEKALEVLPPQRRKVFYLCKIEGKSYSEVSQLLGISKSTINDHIVKATCTVREELIHSHSEMTAMSLVILLLLP